MSKEQRDDLVSSQGHSMTWKRYHRYGGIRRLVELGDFLIYLFKHIQTSVSYINPYTFEIPRSENVNLGETNS